MNEPRDDDRERRGYRQPQRYADLPERTREWIEGLRSSDVRDLEDALRLYRTSQTLGRFWKWALATIIGGFILATQVGEYVVKLAAWFRPGRQ